MIPERGDLRHFSRKAGLPQILPDLRGRLPVQDCDEDLVKFLFQSIS